MCLTHALKTYTPMKKVSGTGYKVFNYYGKHYHFIFSNDPGMRIGTWRTRRYLTVRGWWGGDSKIRFMDDEHGNMYPIGFHVWTKKAFANNMKCEFGSSRDVIKKVEWTGLLARGMQWDGRAHEDCVVVSRIRILEDNDEDSSNGSSAE